ncbi:MAG TPA: patatin-like phospholipase family protein [Longimicrobium sp.]|nr:patatin-like phospholipase family protein [Longimicrobium sp.]
MPSSAVAAAPPTPTPSDASTSVRAVIAAELGLESPVDPNHPDEPPRDLIGLALSGGGIRSATFNLGLLQGLQELRLLRSFDYLSTVSGGGYVGAFWTAWRHRADGREGQLPTEIPAGEAEPRQIRHLREFSNFLAPRLGLFSYDTGRMLVTALSSMLPSLLAALSVLTVVILLWVGAASLLLSPQVGVFSLPIIVAITTAALVGFEVAWHQRREPADGSAYIAAALAGLGWTALAWYLVSAGWYDPASVKAAGIARRMSEQPVWQDWHHVLAPAAAWGAALTLMAVGRWLLSTQLNTPWQQRFHRSADRVRSRLLLLAGVWTGMALLWASGIVVEYQYIGHNIKLAPELGGFTAVLAAAFAKIHHLFSKKKDSGGKVMAVLRPVLPQVLAYAVVGMMALGMVCVIVAGGRDGGILDFTPWHAAAAAAVVLVLVAFFMDPNEVGLHSFYRGRLVRAYPGASNDNRTGRNRETEVVEGDDVRLGEMGGGSARPFHLVCCSANDLASADAMAGLYRGATSAALSNAGYAVDGTWRAWDKTDTKKNPTLGTAITASAAAFNTLMGSKSVELGPGVTFVAAALNLRLGQWLPHPASTGRKTRIAPGWPFLLEMAGQASATGSYVHLSDGGHFENLAVYELIRRRCRVILASDCGADPSSDFDDLGNLVRRAREDFGVEIRLDTRPLKPDEHGLSRQYMVAGDIHYPGGDTGVLLYFKPALVGSEPADVQQYRRRNASFPHETTGDQFYDEAQWESYRRLGFHASTTAFRAVLDGLRLEVRPSRAAGGKPAASTEDLLRPAWMEAFARARREWQPKPVGFDERLARFGDRVAELDGQLRQSGCEFLLQQVYKELDELDRRKIPFSAKIVGLAADSATPAAPADGGDAGAKRGAGPGKRVSSHTLTVTEQKPGSPTPGELSASLYLIRRALLLMQEVFESEGLARNHSHPLYLGLMNWFARWAYAPIFRMWWPLLKTMYPEPFTRFLEKHFALVSIDRSAREAAGGAGEQVFTWVERNAQGFARTCWLLAGGQEPADRAVISYNLRMVYQHDCQYRIQAAQVIAQEADAALLWDGADFFVPPGLWGIGIGSDFLSTLRDADHNGLRGVTHLAVRVRTDPAGGTPARKKSADEMQLYRSAGFSHAPLVGSDLMVDGTPIPIGADWLDAGGHETQWMVATVG